MEGALFRRCRSEPPRLPDLTVFAHLSKLDLSSRSNSATELTTSDESHVEIPHRDLSDEALRGVVESFVLREGTDYGPRDYSLEEKIAAVTRQLERGEAVIVFDPETETVSIVTASPPSRRARIDRATRGDR